MSQDTSEWIRIFFGFVLCIAILIIIPPTYLQFFLLNLVEGLTFPIYGKYLAVSAFVVNLLKYRVNHTSHHNRLGLLIPILCCIGIIFYHKVRPIYEFLFFVAILIMSYYFLYQRDKVCVTVNTDQICLRTVY